MRNSDIERLTRDMVMDKKRWLCRDLDAYERAVIFYFLFGVCRKLGEIRVIV